MAGDVATTQATWRQHWRHGDMATSLETWRHHWRHGDITDDTGDPVTRRHRRQMTRGPKVTDIRDEQAATRRHVWRRYIQRSIGIHQHSVKKTIATPPRQSSQQGWRERRCRKHHLHGVEQTCRPRSSCSCNPLVIP